MASPLDGLVGCHPIFSCEGTAEQVVVRKLLEADVLVFPAVDVVEVTRKRKASDIQADFLGFDYDWPVCIVRVLDSRKVRTWRIGFRACGEAGTSGGSDSPFKTAGLRSYWCPQGSSFTH